MAASTAPRRALASSAPLHRLRAKVNTFADLYRKTRQLEVLNRELETRVEEQTAERRTARARRLAVLRPPVVGPDGLALPSLAALAAASQHGAMPWGVKDRQH